mmetsp:Transcript_1652/g.2376  ORF Transcript_1652/g.2376 Transcript_1652/m.2376 type:complete len:363 (-) Transcript_1652:281-1369(-)|eukprot:CAMPEP_0185281954 /NCGR_PEP_ID=MMETSP1359-20130426/66999_1 /TAXON_ID=552665 /ORGANISM="Bigelowiella longifila, Strain CCMP242" /LENGTH=362 /DNA_ID=CAMNT_0027877439 /DNA_START=562 /DNA_END=1650 /DNA_ORIENTATION=+
MALPKRKIEMSEAFWTSLKRMKYDLDSPRSAIKCPDTYVKYGRCDVLDYHMGREVWRTCRVLEHDTKHQAVFVHWEGWGHHWDEWIDLTLGRRVIAPLWTKVPRLLRTGKQCEFNTPISIGIGGPDGDMIRIAPRGTPFYPHASILLSTCLDSQSNAIVRVYQGERLRAVDNKFLGLFEISNIPSAQQGVPQIRLTLCLHPDGLLSIRAHFENILTSSSSSSTNDQSIEDALAGIDIHDVNPNPEEVEAALEIEKIHQEEDTNERKKKGDPWEERKCRQWTIDEKLRHILGRDVTDLIQDYDDELRRALCVVPLQGNSSMSRIGVHFTLLNNEDYDDDNDDGGDDADEDDHVAAPPLLDTTL